MWEQKVVEYGAFYRCLAIFTAIGDNVPVTTASLCDWQQQCDLVTLYSQTSRSLGQDATLFLILIAVWNLITVDI